MYEIDVLILTKSYKKRKNNIINGAYSYCVAGIDIKTGAWVRLVKDDSGEALYASEMQVPSTNGGTCCVDCLDVVTVPIDHDSPLGFQTENKVVVAGKIWKYKQTLNPDSIATIFQSLESSTEPKYIFGSVDEYETVSYLKRLGIDYSLQAYVVTDLQTSHYSHGAYLDYNGYHYPKMTITDPVYRKKYTHIDKAVIVVSIPAEGYDGGNNVYKFVSAVYPC